MPFIDWKHFFEEMLAYFIIGFVFFSGACTAMGIGLLIYFGVFE